MMQESLGLVHFLQQADGVSHTILALLLLMSVGTWYVIGIKTLGLARARRHTTAFLKVFWEARDLSSLAAIMTKNSFKTPFARLVAGAIEALDIHRHGQRKGLSEAGTQDEFLTRAMKRAIEDDRVNSEFGLTFIATVASSAPFLGLFGTVWGIYHALLAIGASGQGTLDKVAGPVGEALIMTAFGLVVAIPAAISYNFFARVNRTLFAKIDSFAHDVFTLVSTGLNAAVLKSELNRTADKARPPQPADTVLAGGH